MLMLVLSPFFKKELLLPIVTTGIKLFMYKLLYAGQYQCLLRLPKWLCIAHLHSEALSPMCD